MNRGNVFSDKGDNDRAIADYNKAIELDPKVDAAYVSRGAAGPPANDDTRARQQG